MDMGTVRGWCCCVAAEDGRGGGGGGVGKEKKPNIPVQSGLIKAARSHRCSREVMNGGGGVGGFIWKKSATKTNIHTTHSPQVQRCVEASVSAREKKNQTLLGETSVQMIMSDYAIPFPTATRSRQRRRWHLSHLNFKINK